MFSFLKRWKLEKEIFQMKYTLGIDVGTASIGLAAWELDEQGNPTNLAHVDTVVFNEPCENKSGKPKSGSRRVARLARRQNQRRSQRERKLYHIARNIGFTEDELFSQKQGVEQIDILALRVQALSAKITMGELFAVLSHIGKNRGYKNILKNAKILCKDIAVFTEKRASDAGEKTLGQVWLEERKQAANERKPWKNLVEKGTFTIRQDIESEVEIILDKQSEFHEILLDKYKNYPKDAFKKCDMTIKDALKEAIFYQRPIKWSIETIGHCELELDFHRAAIAQPVFQTYRIEQALSNLRWYKKGHKDGLILSDAAKNVVRELLFDNAKVSFSKIYKELENHDLKITERFSKDRQEITGNKDVGMLGNSTRSVWKKLKILDKWEKLQDKEQEMVIITLANLGDKDEALDDTLEERMEQSCEINDVPLSAVTTAWQFVRDLADHEKYNVFIGMGFNTGRAAYSVKAMQQLIPLIKSGYDERNAIDELYPERFKRSGPMGKLRSIKTLETVNPSVNKALREFERIFKYALHKLGDMPERIVLEFSREMNNSYSKRKEIEKIGKFNERKRNDAVKELTNAHIPATAKNISRYRLYTEQGYRCAYSGQQLSLEQAINECQIDHIFPRSKNGSNSWYNKVLVTSGLNLQKGDKTPMQAVADGTFTENNFSAIKQMAEKFKEKPEENSPWHQKNLRRRADLLLSNAAPEGLDANAMERRDTETSWIARSVREWLEDIVKPEQIIASRGTLTYHLRCIWGIDNILPEMRIINKLPLLTKPRGDGDSEARHIIPMDIWKKARHDKNLHRLQENQFDKRCDHRHHMIDAAVSGLITTKMIQDSAKISSQFGNLYIKENRETGERINGYYVKCPVFDIHNKIKECLTNYVVWHKPDRKPSAALFKENAYRLDTKNDYVSKRVPLKDLLHKSGVAKTRIEIEDRVVGGAVKIEIIKHIDKHLDSGLSIKEILIDEPLFFPPGSKNRLRKVKAFYKKAGLVKFKQNIDRLDERNNTVYLNEGFACVRIHKDSTTGKLIKPLEFVPYWQYKQLEVPGVQEVFPNDLLYDQNSGNFFVVCSFGYDVGIKVKQVTETAGFNDVSKINKKTEVDSLPLKKSFKGVKGLKQLVFLSNRTLLAQFIQQLKSKSS